MKILVVNDDGIQHHGIWELATAMEHLGDVVVYSPDRNYSGAGMSVSLTNEFHLRRVGPPSGFTTQVSGFTGDATPATLAALGCAFAFNSDPDIIVSGINPGWNTGAQPYVCSGTAGAARVAVDRGFTGIAVSHAPSTNENKGAIARATARFIEAAHVHKVLGQPQLVNINTPGSYASDTPVRLTRPARFTLFADAARDGEPSANGELTTMRLRYGNVFDGSTGDGDEIAALRDGVVSISVTEPLTHAILMEDPWPAVAAAFAVDG